MKYDIEYETSIRIIARGIEAGSRDEAIRLADTQWYDKCPVITEPSGTASWLEPEDIHVSEYWSVNHVTGGNGEEE